MLFWKKQGEVALQRSGIDYTIVRPGGFPGCCGFHRLGGPSGHDNRICAAPVLRSMLVNAHTRYQLLINRWHSALSWMALSWMGGPLLRRPPLHGSLPLQDAC